MAPQLHRATIYRPIECAALMKTIKKLEMWANAQRDGRPSEHRWRPLLNAAKFG